MRVAGNEYSIREAAGAFGDLGTLIPFVVGYITVNHMDPAGILIAFGVFKLWAGLYFKTPVPIQPMKAIGTAAITHAATISPGAIWASGLFGGIFWLVMGVTGTVSWIAKITSRPIVQGIVLSLGLGFILEGVRMMQGDYVLAALATALTFFLLSHQRVPAMLVLLGFGVTVALVREPALLAGLAECSLRFQLPTFGLAHVSWQEAITGVVVLGLPQVALTLGNAIIATVEENNTLFPDRRITVKEIAVDHGIMNLVGTSLGGVPMCHGAGGMAGHVRFGARTGGALVILGVLILFIGLFLSDSVATLFKLFPRSLLGTILLFGGLELAAGAHGDALKRGDRYVVLLTAGISLWNMGVGYLAGLALWYAVQREWIRV